MRPIDADGLVKKVMACPKFNSAEELCKVAVALIDSMPTCKTEKCGSFAVVREGKRMCLNCGRIIDHGYMCEACSEVD